MAQKIKTIMTIILSILMTLCVLDFFYDIPYIQSSISGIGCGILAIILLNVTD